MRLYNGYSGKFEWTEDASYICPKCGEHLAGDMRLYIVEGEIIGCESCMTEAYAEDVIDDEEPKICPSCRREITLEENVLLNGDNEIIACSQCYSSNEGWAQALEEDEMAKDAYYDRLVDEALEK